jgi:hypothetical protein
MIKKQQIPISMGGHIHYILAMNTSVERTACSGEINIMYPAATYPHGEVVKKTNSDLKEINNTTWTQKKNPHVVECLVPILIFRITAIGRYEGLFTRRSRISRGRSPREI